MDRLISTIGGNKWKNELQLLAASSLPVIRVSGWKEICKDRSWRHRLHQAQDQCIGNEDMFSRPSLRKESGEATICWRRRAFEQATSAWKYNKDYYEWDSLKWSRTLKHARGCIVPLIKVNARDKTTGVWSALTTSVTDLNSSLTNMKRDNFTHYEIKIGNLKWSGERIYDNKFYYFLLKILFPSLLQVAHNICKQWRHFLSFEEKLSSNTKSTPKIRLLVILS